jgi:hypothetical protein
MKVFISKPRTVEVVKWDPDDRGKQKGGWPKHWKGAKRWLVNSISLSLYLNTGTNEIAVKKGEYVVREVDSGRYRSCDQTTLRENFDEVK